MDNNLNNTLEGDIDYILWQQLDLLVGKPMWDNKEKRWRVLTGYSRHLEKYKMFFSDIDCMLNGKFCIYEKDRFYLTEHEDIETSTDTNVTMMRR